ncbi:MAG: GNAT family N-acetyltransferase [Gordonia sp. (in: high G+C Gram-positive bacteria)]
MTDLDKAAARREITDALLTAFERRHDVLDAIVDAADRDAAVAAIAELLGKSTAGAEAVLNMSFHQLTKDARRANQAELDDLNQAITFTIADRPASSGDTLDLRPFSADADSDILAARTGELNVAADGSGSAPGPLGDEIAQGLERVDAEDAVWLVALEGDDKIGLVFGELAGAEVDVRVWIHPEHRKKGLGTAALRKSRSEMAIAFPGVPMVVRAPSA